MDLKGSIIDSHAHCGIQDRSFDQSFESYYSYVEGTQIEGVIMFSPVMEIYDRYDPYFEDTMHWQKKRKMSNEYLLSLGNKKLTVIPYLFIWNDFQVESLTDMHKGIKWHRHASEPVYNYDSKECKQAIAEINRRNMPVVYEEELENTIVFIKELASKIRVIIPHLGGLNGGYKAIAAHNLWERPYVYTDTSLASAFEISDYIERYGHERIMFGSDFPFGDPESELIKIQKMNLKQHIKEAITGKNIMRLLSDSNV
ncbi:MAG TPA: metal-dependent hydrolase [Desulfobacterales bacterium]|nr:metal-dependent hydrolase [Desulfobacterales bacterium]